MASMASKIEKMHFGVKSSSLLNPTKQKISQEQEQQHGGRKFVISIWKCFRYPPREPDSGLSYRLRIIAVT